MQHNKRCNLLKIVYAMYMEMIKGNATKSHAAAVLHLLCVNILYSLKYSSQVGVVTLISKAPCLSELTPQVNRVHKLN